jgi:putative endonuclease
VAPRSLTGLLGRLAGVAERGASGEALACRHLEAEGLVVLERNYKCRSGEIDIVARDGDATVFVEVKERRSASHGAGHEAVTRGKRHRIIRAARLYAAAHGLTEEPMRFDVVSIDWEGGDTPRVRHDRDAFDAGGR